MSPSWLLADWPARPPLFIDSNVFRVAEPAAGDETHPSFCRLLARSSRRQMCVAHQHHAKSSRGADFDANLSICHHTHGDTAAALQYLAHIDCYPSKSNPSMRRVTLIPSKTLD